MSRKEPLRAVKGMRDILPPESALWGRIEDVARRILRAYAYQEIRTPLVEPTELFARGVGTHTDIVTKEMYTWEDRDKTSLSLRPEATASVMRAYIEHRLDQRRGVKKFYYIGPMFRRERPQKGRYRQFYQIGAEAIGSDSPAVDAEVVELLVELLADLAIADYTLLLNSVGCKQCRPQYLETLRRELARSAISFAKIASGALKRILCACSTAKCRRTSRSLIVCPPSAIRCASSARRISRSCRAT
jgi:histidyl-tRNA synthetase